MSYVATRLKDRIRTDYIRKDGAKKGFKLPTVKELASVYEVSAPTIGKALEILAAEGAVTKRRGSGIYVEELPPVRDRGDLIKELRIGFVAAVLQNPLSFQLLEGVEKVVTRNRAILELGRSQWDLKEERAQVLAMKERGCKGVVIFPNCTRKSAEEDYLSTELRDFNIVIADLYQPWMKRSRVLFDNFTAGYNMARSLIQSGRTNISFLVHEWGFVSRSVCDRMEGYKKALTDCGMNSEETILSFDSINDPTLRHFIDALDNVVSKKKTDAIMMPFDAYVPVAIKYLRTKGFRIPEDILITGFDNTATGRTEDWPTTSPDFAAMGERAAELLFDQIENKGSDLQEVVLPVPVLFMPQAEGIHESVKASIENVASYNPIGLKI